MHFFPCLVLQPVVFSVGVDCSGKDNDGGMFCPLSLSPATVPRSGAFQHVRSWIPLKDQLSTIICETVRHETRTREECKEVAEIQCNPVQVIKYRKEIDQNCPTKTDQNYTQVPKAKCEQSERECFTEYNSTVSTVITVDFTSFTSNTSASSDRLSSIFL